MDKAAYLSPSTGLLEITAVRDARPFLNISLDLGIPNFTVFSMKLPLAEDDPKTMSGLIAEALHVLLDEVSAFMLSCEYREEVIVQIYAAVLACFNGMTSEADTDKGQSQAGQDAFIKTFEGTFNIPSQFVNETQEKVVTAATRIQRLPQVRRLELSHSKPHVTTVEDTERAIRQYRTRTIKTQPSPMYVLVFDQMGRPKGTIPVGNNFPKKLLDMVYKKAAAPEYTPTVKFTSDTEMKYNNLNGIPHSIYIGEEHFTPEAYAGNDMAMYRGEGGGYVVKFPDGHCVPFPERPSILTLKANNFPVPGEYQRWRNIREEEKPSDVSQTEDATDSQGRELNETDHEYTMGLDSVKPIGGDKFASMVFTARDAMRCSECGTEVPVNEDECPECGAPVFWSGTNDGASGILPICSSTGRICLGWRSSSVHQGDCWGTFGGAVQAGKTPAESAKTEMEEVGYHGSIHLHPAYVFTSGNFKYYNFIGVVPDEFAYSGGSWETDYITWASYEEIVEDMKTRPGDYHSGLVALFQHSGTLIEKLSSPSSNNPEEN